MTLDQDAMTEMTEKIHKRYSAKLRLGTDHKLIFIWVFLGGVENLDSIDIEDAKTNIKMPRWISRLLLLEQV